MGNASTICVDKTGTLTTNRMTVVRVFANKTDNKNPLAVKQLSSVFVHNLAMHIGLNSQPKSMYVESASGLPVQQGNKVCLFWGWSIDSC